MKTTLNRIGILSFFVGLYGVSFANSWLMSKNDYIEKWKNTAVQNQVRFGIPASITLAQGIIESAYGNSELARNANNHFGIKCHNDWEGKRYYQDDDQADECFRNYANAADSYRDHSLFLTNGARYAFLFTLPQTDYKAWAKGLKKAGYATNPRYAELLIEAIETNDLAQLDEISSPEVAEIRSEAAQSNQSNVATLKLTSHKVYMNGNNTSYVVVKAGDTFYRIAKEFNIKLWQLRMYNDFEKHKDLLEPGEVIYLAPKRFRMKGKTKHITLREETSIIQLSQAYGLRLKSIMNMNNIAFENAVLPAGSKVILK